MGFQYVHSQPMLIPEIKKNICWLQEQNLSNPIPCGHISIKSVLRSCRSKLVAENRTLRKQLCLLKFINYSAGETNKQINKQNTTNPSI